MIKIVLKIVNYGEKIKMISRKKKGQMKTKKLKTSKSKILTVPEISKSKKISKISSFHLSRKSKGQMKIQQMAFMLMAVTLFFVLAGIFILIVKFSGLKESASELEERNAMLLVTKLANSPEFACGSAFGSTRINCVDLDKVMMLKENIAKYKGFWSVSNIEIRKIYPKLEGDINCNLGNYNECNLIRIYDTLVTGYDMSTFISLCRKDSFEGETYDKCELAIISASYEEK